MSLVETQAAHYFVLVARAQSFSKAAIELATTQSNVTAKMRLLEEQVGRPLFRRHSRGVELTDTGKVFLKYCEDLVRLAESAQRCIGATDVITAELRIGIYYTLATYLTPEVIADFMTNNRGVHLTVRVGSTEELRAQLAEQTLDCAFISAIGADRTMTVHARVRDELGWLVKAGSLSCPPEQLLNVLATRPIYSIRKGGLYEASIKQLFQDAGVVARMPLFLELGSKEILKSMLLTGLGFTFVSRNVFLNEIEAGIFDFYPIETQFPRLQPVLVTSTAHPKVPVVQTFVEHFLKFVGR